MMFTGGQETLNAMARAASLQMELARNPDRTPDEVGRSETLAAELRTATIALRDAFDLWGSEPLGLPGARGELQLHGESIVSGKELPPYVTTQVSKARRIARRYRFFHWPLEFPGLFHRSRPGFDVVVGNPPWNEITVEELGFYALREPGLRGIPRLVERRERIAELDQLNPDWRSEFEDQQSQLAAVREFFSRTGGYELQGVGDRDLYQLFCERYTHLLRQGGNLGVVLPRTAFLAQGAKGFRQWLFEHTTVKRVDFLLNSGRWAFQMEPRYTVALLAGRRLASSSDSTFDTTGPSLSLQQFLDVTSRRGIRISANSLGSARVVPLTPTQMHADVLARLRRGVQFDALKNPENQNFLKARAAASHLAPYTELHETQQRALFSHSHGDPVWKGRCFDQYEPHGHEPAGYSDWDEVLTFVQRKRTRSPVFRRMFPKEFLADPITHPINHSRIAFRDVTNRTNSRTVIACLIPPRTPLTNSAPYLVFSGWSAIEQASLLGTMNSLAFDWLSRRYVELHLNFYVLNMLCFPSQDNSPWMRIGDRAARLSCVDHRFEEFAAEAGVDCEPLTDVQRNNLRAEIDALVARAYDLTEDELRFIFTDFTENAVSPAYRDQVLGNFERL
ncbi:MAG: hypothetical protein OXG65_07175 [Chloroflexi bacterium]|nr:hypothetical protein [Chloroflexota bacterium]